jgi:hypothetical protein
MCSSVGGYLLFVLIRCIQTTSVAGYTAHFHCRLRSSSLSDVGLMTEHLVAVTAGSALVLMPASMFFHLKMETHPSLRNVA